MSVSSSVARQVARPVASSLAGMSFSGSTASGVLFDSAAGDSFVDAFTHDVDATLNVTASNITFNHTTSTPKTLHSRLKDSISNVLKHCYDDWTITGSFTVQSLPFDATNTSGVMVGTLNDYQSLYFGHRMRSLGAGANQVYFYGESILNGAALGTPGTLPEYTAGDVIHFEVRRYKDLFRVTQTLNSGSPDVINLTMVIPATSYAIPRLFGDFSIQWMYANVELTNLKIEVGTPNARFICIGDSITTGINASTYGNGWTQKLWTDYPDEVLCLGAAAASVGLVNGLGDPWIDTVTMLENLNPTRAFIMIGTNDHLFNQTLGQYQTNMEAFIALVESYGCEVVLLTIPPCGSAPLEPWNAWLATLGKPVIDIYTALLGTSYSLHASYDSGDGIHPNDAGNTVIYNTVKAAIVANGW